MLLEASAGYPRSAHVIVLGNEKGGSGKSTTSMHITVGLLKAGQRVATIDLDCRQKSFTHYVENRRTWAERAGLPLELPTHFHVARAEGPRVEDNEAFEFAGFAEAITAAEHTHDFVVIDTPASDSYLMRLAHSMADTLVTPVNDSFVDFDVLGTVDPTTFAVTGVSHYAEMVRQARRQRRIVDGGSTDWIVVRNRLSSINSRNKKVVGDSLNQLGLRMGFRLIDGFAERVIYRELSARPDGARPDGRGYPGRPAEPVACDGAAGGADAARCPQAVHRREGPAACGGARGMVRLRRQAARSARHHRRAGRVANSE
jgi:chromosome partitioning protein